MKSGKLKINDLKGSEYNPRMDLRSGDEEYESLYQSIQEFGYVSPIIVNEKDNVIVGGHQRLKVLKDLGYKEVDVVFIEIDKRSEKLLNIALNKIEGEWDISKLENLLKNISDDGFDATLTGFSMDEIDSMIGDFDPLDADGEDDEDKKIEKDEMMNCPHCDYSDQKDVFLI